MLWSGCEYAGPEGGVGTGVAAQRLDTAVSGVVRDAEGRAMGDLDLQLVTIAENGDIGEWVPFLQRCATGQSGEFYIKAIPPGRYYLGANLMPPLSATVPRTFYPGTRVREQAIPLEIRVGHRIEGLVLTAPDYGGRRKLRIVVVTAKGAPMPGVWIASEYPDGEDSGELASLGWGLKTGPDGTVVVDALAGAEYHIRAEVSSIVQLPMRQRVKVPPGNDAATVLLVR
jgi:hypothetical protein